MHLRTKSKEHRKKLRQRLRIMENFAMPVEQLPRYVVRSIDAGGVDTLHMVELAKAHHDECAPHLPFDEKQVAAHCVEVFNDNERTVRQAFILFEGAEAIGYLVCHSMEYYFCKAVYSQTEVVFIKQDRRSWQGFAMLMKVFDEWSNEIDAVQRYTGVARVDEKEAEKLQKLFPRLGYKWVGSYYMKEIGR